MKTIVLLLIMGFLAWSGGLVWYFLEIPTAAPEVSESTDTVIALTGAKGRIEEGLTLLEQGKAKYMLISGVGQDTAAKELMSPEQYAKLGKRVSLGKEATNTYGNALESARWLKHYEFTSMRLVTSWYHMPRSMAEFDRQMPASVEIVPHPVFSENFNPQTWWRDPETAQLAAIEYNKYLASWLRSMLEF